jgi:hypothetical protein
VYTKRASDSKEMSKKPRLSIETLLYIRRRLPRVNGAFSVPIKGSYTQGIENGQFFGGLKYKRAVRKFLTKLIDEESQRNK